MSSWRTLFSVVLVLTLLGGAAAAQVPIPPPSEGTPPDVVMSPGGGMLRGTIVESVPGQYVVIMLPTGETRRIEWPNVTYAGPASGAPQQVQTQTRPSYGAAAQLGTTAPQFQPSTPAGGVHVRFESPQPGITFHRVTGTATATAWGSGHAIAVRAYSFERLCTAPCELTLDPDSYHLALSVGTGAEVPGQVIDIRRSGTLYGQYVDREGLRVAGWLTIIGGGVAGALMMTMPLLTTTGYNNDWLGWMIAGGAVLLVSEIVGMILAFQSDGAVIRFE